MRNVVVVVAAIVPCAAMAQSATTSAQGDVSLTIYNNDLALVQDVRQMSLPLGRTRQEFPDVSAAIRPETVTLNAGGTGIVEQNFDYDLLTPAKLMDKAVGQTVTSCERTPRPAWRPARLLRSLPTTAARWFEWASGSKC